MTEVPKNDEQANSILDSVPELPGLSNDLSPEDVDKIIETADPEFAAKLKELGQDTSISLAEIHIEDSRQALYAEIDSWKAATGWRKTLYRFFPLAPVVSLWSRRLRERAWVMSRRGWFFLIAAVSQGARSGFTKSRLFIVGLFQFLKARVRSGVDQWSKLSGVHKLSFVGLLIMFAIVTGYLTVAVKKDVIPEPEALFLSSLEEISTESYNADGPDELFYDNVRVAKNLILLDKMVVNLKPSEESGPNPMAAFELLVEGNTSDVMVEIKDREVAVRQLMLRSLEEFSFADAESSEGKRRMSARLAEELSQFLTTGRVRRVLIKTVLVKP